MNIFFQCPCWAYDLSLCLCVYSVVETKKGHHWKYVGTIFQQVNVYKHDLGVLQARQVEITEVLELLRFHLML